MEIQFRADGLIPVVTQDWQSKDVLMVAYMNQEALDLTVQTKKVHYFSRSRQSIWLKGETSGHFQLVKQMLVDCDTDTLLVLVEQVGAACHTGNRTCFYRTLDGAETQVKKHILDELYDTILDRKENPKEGSYTNYLFDKGLDKILKKVGEETAEVIIASKNRDSDEMTYEISDLLYHLNVLMVQNGVAWDDVFNELAKRR